MNLFTFGKITPTEIDYYYDSDQHYKLFSNSFDFEYFHKVFLNSVETVQTTQNIKFNSIIEFGSKKRALKSILGLPDFSTKLLALETISYKEKLGLLPCRLFFHFYKNKLFMFSYVFSSVYPTQKEQLYEILSSKYLNNTPLKTRQNRIVDPKGNSIQINDDVNFSIDYVFNNKEIRNSINKEFDKIEEINLNSNRMIRQEIFDKL